MLDRRIRAYGITLALAVCLCLHAAAFAADAAPGLSIEKRARGGVSFVVARVHVDQVSLHLYWKDPSGQPYGNFDNLRRELAERGQKLVFATNAGIYARDCTPLGLHVEDGREMEPLNLKTGGGNFFLKPNGVFYVAKGHVGVLSAEDYAAADIKPDVAVQSGPMLLRNGVLHPRFIPDSDSRYVRNGVGVVSDTEAVFVLSEQPVNFNDFALFFRDELGCKDAIYLDGALSAMYAPAAGREDTGLSYVGMFGVTVPQPAAGAAAPGGGGR